MRRFVVSNIFLWLFWSNNFCNTDFKIVVWRLLLLLGRSKQLSVNSKRRPHNLQPNDWMSMKPFFSFGCVSLLFVCRKIELVHACFFTDPFHGSCYVIRGLSWTKDDLLLPLPQSPSSKMQMTNQQRDLPLALGNHNYFVQFHCFFYFLFSVSM